jgi:anti-sigma regulatory factor (Ser/Thr protein kinase)
MTDANQQISDHPAATVERRWTIQRGDLRGACAARRDFARYLDSKPTGAAERYDATLIFGELVANAVKHARESVTVEVLENGWSTVHVVDDGDCFCAEAVSPRPLHAEGGRGLYIVSQLARALEIAPRERSCEVTAVLPIRSRT